MLLMAGLLTGFTAGFVAGCGQTAKPGGGVKSVTKPGVTASSGSGETLAPAPSNKYVRTDAEGRKWISDIPYDVFYDDPLAVVSSNQTVVAAAPSTANAPPATTPEPGTPAPTKADSGGSDWKSFIPMEQIQDETKRIRNHLTQGLQNQGVYNGNYKDLAVDGAVMAALAGIVANHPEDVSWKANSRFIREFGLELSQSATALGKEPYSKSQAAAEKIIAVLDGSVPADAGDPPPSRPFGEVANRAGVMKRIEKASEWMRSNINTEAKFKSELEQVQKEAALLATLGKVISDESYESAAEEDYQKFAKRLVEGGQEAAAAAKDQSFPKFGEAMNKINKVCAECHASYGNG